MDFYLLNSDTLNVIEYLVSGKLNHLFTSHGDTTIITKANTFSWSQTDSITT